MKNEYDITSYDYYLPEEQIAFHPVEKRDESKLLVCTRKNSIFKEYHFSDIHQFMHEGDVLVLNNTKVFPARLVGKKPTGATIEVMLLEKVDDCLWKAMIKPGKRIKDGSVILFDGNVTAIPEKTLQEGLRLIRFDCKIPFMDYLDKFGEIPLPPYIARKQEESDAERYQTVYATEKGAVAAPTAGLHFTTNLLNEIKKKGVSICTVTLHVGKGTFAPVKVNDIRKHKMEKEWYNIPKETVRLIEHAKSSGKKVFVTGTTTSRALESYAKTGKTEDWTSIFIYPPYKFKMVDALITNFHLPKSTLLMMISAFSGREKVKTMYDYALKNNFRFYSYGDACLLL